MEYTSALRESLNGHFEWNKARITYVVKMLLALIVSQIVNMRPSWKYSDSIKQ